MRPKPWTNGWPKARISRDTHRFSASSCGAGLATDLSSAGFVNCECIPPWTFSPTGACVLASNFTSLQLRKCSKLRAKLFEPALHCSNCQIAIGTLIATKTEHLLGGPNLSSFFLRASYSDVLWNHKHVLSTWILVCDTGQRYVIYLS